MATIRELVARIVFKDDASKTISGVNKELNKAKKEGEQLQQVFNLLGGSAAVAGIAMFAQETIRAAAALEEQQVRLQALAGDDYPAIQKALMDTIEAGKGLADEAGTAAAVNQALKFGASVNLITGGLKELQQISAITGDDLTATMQGVAMAAQTGSIRFLKSNSILAKHIEQFKALGEGYDEATKRRREFFLVDILQKESESIQKQYNKTLQTTAAQLKIVATQWDNVKEAIGGIILVVVGPFIRMAAKLLRFLGETEKGLVILRLAVITLIPLIGTLLVYALYSAATAAWALLQPFIPFIVIALAVGAAIAALVLIIEDLITWFEGGESVLGKFVDSVIKKLTELWNFIKSVPILGQALGVVAGGTVQIVQALRGGDTVKEVGQNLEMRASGGPVVSNTPYMVGEEGPELFVPKSSGYIKPNSSTGTSSAGATTSTGVTIANLVGSLTFNVSNTGEAVQAMEKAVLDALDKLSETILRTEAGIPL